MAEYIFSDNEEDIEYYRLRLLEDAFDKKTKSIIDSEIHLEFGGSAVAKVMSASTEALKEKYIETGECSEDDIGKYIKGAKDPRSFATYYATTSIVSIKKPDNGVR